MNWYKKALYENFSYDNIYRQMLIDRLRRHLGREPKEEEIEELGPDFKPKSKEVQNEILERIKDDVYKVRPVPYKERIPNLV